MALLKRNPSLQSIPVPQEHTMGCAVACVAARCGLNYQKGLRLFSRAQNAWTRGYYCGEVVQGFRYRYDPYDHDAHHRFLSRVGTIIFIDPDRSYPVGHYLLRVPEGWMNSWVNCPRILPVQAAVQRKRIGKTSFIIYEAE